MERAFRLESGAALHGGDDGKGSNLQGFFTFFKSMFGAGILVLTHKFSDVGLPLGVLVFVAVAFFVLVTTYMLLDCHLHCCAIANKELKSFEDIAGFILGKYGRRTIRYCIALLQLLFCTGFMIVFCDNMQDVFPVLNRAEYAGLALIPLTVLSWIPNMRDMWVVSVLGLAVYLVGVIGLSTYDGAKNYEQPDDLMEWKAGGAASFFGVCAYAMEGICLVIPTSVTLQRREDSMAVITLGLVLYCAVTLAFAMFTFSAGLGSCDTIIECLEEGFPTTGVRLALCAALLLTHPVFIIVVANIVEGRLFRDEYSPLVEVDEDFSAGPKRESGRRSPGIRLSDIIDLSPRSLRVKGIRFALVGITCAIAASGIKFSVFSGLVGSVLTSFVGFVMPALMWWQLYRVVGTEGLSSSEGEIFSPLLSSDAAMTPETATRDQSASAATGGPKSSMFTLLSPSSSMSAHADGAPLLDRPITPTESSSGDPGRDWVYSSFIAEGDALPPGGRTSHDVVLQPPPLVKSESDINGFLKSNSGDESSVDSRDLSGRPYRSRRDGAGRRERRSWFGRLFEWSSLSASGPRTHITRTLDEGSISADGMHTPDSRRSSDVTPSEGLLRSVDRASTKTRDSIYEYDMEVREPSNATQRYRLRALTLTGHLTAFFFVALGVVAMITGGISGVQELIHGE